MLKYIPSDTKQCRQAKLEAPIENSKKRDEFCNDYRKKGVDFIMKKYGTTQLKIQIKYKQIKLVLFDGEKSLNSDMIYYADYFERRSV